jgi:hypothetical protein
MLFNVRVCLLTIIIDSTLYMLLLVTLCPGPLWVLPWERCFIKEETCKEGKASQEQIYNGNYLIHFIQTNQHIYESPTNFKINQKTKSNLNF